MEYDNTHSNQLPKILIHILTYQIQSNLYMRVMLYSRHLQIADPFSETGQIIVKTLQKNLCIADTYKEFTFWHIRHKFYLYISDTKQQFNFLSRENALVKKNWHFLFHASIHFIIYNFFNLHFHPSHHSFVFKKPHFTGISCPSVEPWFTLLQIYYNQIISKNDKLIFMNVLERVK